MESQRPTKVTGARLMLPSGALLAFCFFLPAVKVCGQPTAPFQVPASFPPYLFGLLAAAIAALLLRRRIVPAVLRWGTWALATVGGCALSIAASHNLLEVKILRVRVMLGATAAAAALSTTVLLLLLRRRQPPHRRLSRTLLAGGVLSALWCLLLTTDGLKDVCYGLWLSLVACFGLVASSMLLSRDPA